MKINNHCPKCGEFMSFYAKQCQICYFKSLQGSGNPMFGKKRPDSKQRMLNNNPRKFITQPNLKEGLTLIDHFCKDCGKKLSDYTAERCHKCAAKRIWNQGRCLDKHHIDCNHKNDKDENKIELTDKEHRNAHVSLELMGRKLFKLGIIKFSKITKKYYITRDFFRILKEKE